MNINSFCPLQSKYVALALRVLIAANFVVLGGSTNRVQATDPVDENAVIRFKQDADKELPATEAGVLMKLLVKQGDRVKAGQEIGLIDDREPQMQKKVAQYALSGAIKRWKDEVEIKYAAKQAEVTEADYQQMLETNKIAAKAVTEVELRRAKLDWERAVLAIEKAGHEQVLAMYEAYTKQAELAAAELGITRRTIVAPFDGEIIEILRQQDEWVSPGDPILRLARRDVMDASAFVEQSECDRSQVRNCEVTVEVEMAGGRKEALKGRVFYVSPVVQAGKYQVRAEVPNREEFGDWMLPDGQRAKVTIHLNTGSAAVPTEISQRP